MASTKLRRGSNVAGAFFVDTTCIDCDTCRWMAPETFDREGAQSRVHAQPSDPEARRRAALALVACPTASIGHDSSQDDGESAVRDAARAFPVPIEGLESVSHCGYHAESSFGAASYLLQRPEGNVLVDSPRFAAPLVKRLEELGGIDTIFLTHRDDVADHRRFAEHFGARRVLHRADRTKDTEDVEIWVEGQEPHRLAEDLLVVPMAGHTRGSACLLYRDQVLFTGDHLAWSANLQGLYAFRSACWYDWDVQRASMARLDSHSFEWVLPGHGRRGHFEAGEMKAHLQRCVLWMESVA